MRTTADGGDPGAYNCPATISARGDYEGANRWIGCRSPEAAPGDAYGMGEKGVVRRGVRHESMWLPPGRGVPCDGASPAGAASSDNSPSTS